MVTQAPAIIWMACIRKANDLALVSRMSAATLIMRRNATIDEKRGETTHDTTIMISWFQLMREAWWVAATPAPIYAPTTVCVPEIGMPKTVERRMKLAEQMRIANIMRCVWKKSI